MALLSTHGNPQGGSEATLHGDLIGIGDTLAREALQGETENLAEVA